MNKRWYFRREKRPVGDRRGIESPVKSLFRVLSSNVFGQDGSSPPSLWDRNHGGVSHTRSRTDPPKTVLNPNRRRRPGSEQDGAEVDAPKRHRLQSAHEFRRANQAPANNAELIQRKEI